MSFLSEPAQDRLNKLWPYNTAELQKKSFLLGTYIDASSEVSNIMVDIRGMELHRVFLWVILNLYSNRKRC